VSSRKEVWLRCTRIKCWEIFGPKREDITGERRRLHNEELYVMYTSTNTYYYSGDELNKNENGEKCSTCGERGGVYRVVVGKPERKRPRNT
jgi:hypothetical protein